MIRCPKILRWAVWALAILFYFYEYVLRVAPSGSPTQLMQAFGISASGFGAAMAFYFYAYTPMQIPAGLFIDRFGARIWLTLSTLLCAIGAFFFALASGFALAAFSRFLMGAGSACAFVALIYLSSHWFDPRRLPVLLALGNSLGMLGAALGEGPLSYLLHSFGFRSVNMIFGFIGLVLAILIFLIVRNNPPDESHYTPPESSLSISESLKAVVQNGQTWINSIAAMLFYTVTAAFAGLWAPNFVNVAYGFSVQKAALASSLFFVGWIAAGPLIGKIAKHLKNKRPLVIATPLLALICLVILVYFPLQIKIWPYLWLFLCGCFSSGQLLHYSLAVKLNSLKVKGTAGAITNCIVFVGTSIMQPLVGTLLDAMWSGKSAAGVRIYSLATFQKALVGFPIALLLASLISWIFLKESKKFKV